MERENTRPERRTFFNQMPSLRSTTTVSRSCGRSFHLSLIFFLGLLIASLLAGLVILDVQYRETIAELSSISDNLTEYLQATKEELTMLQSLKQQENDCPGEWLNFNGSYYFVSTESGSWDKGSEACRDRGAALVVIDNTEEQLFVSTLTTKGALIGLTDSEDEGTWKWVDGTPLTLKLWAKNQPDNGRGLPGVDNEDCAHISTDHFWYDLSCTVPLRWICEKKLAQRKK